MPDSPLVPPFGDQQLRDQRRGALAQDSLAWAEQQVDRLSEQLHVLQGQVETMREHAELLIARDGASEEGWRLQVAQDRLQEQSAHREMEAEKLRRRADGTVMSETISAMEQARQRIEAARR